MLSPLIALVAAARVAAGGRPPAAAPDVEIAIAAAAPAAAVAVREDLEDLLSRRGLAARYRQLAAVARDEVLRPATEAPCALACIWIDLGVAKAARAFVYISATASAQVVIRSLPLPDGVDEVAREEVAQIVATSVEALQAGRPLPVGANVADAPLAKAVRPPAPPPVARAAHALARGPGRGRRPRGRLARRAAGGEPFSRCRWLRGGRRARFAPALWLSLGAFSSDAAGDPVALRFRGGELAALVAIGTPPTLDGKPRRAVVRLGVGPGVELREATSLAPGGAPGVSLDGARLDPCVFVRAAARLEVRLSDAVGVFLAAACDARVVSRRYTLERDGMSEALFQPDVLRPSVIVGLDARLAGEGAP